ncbi:unnamed protein product [Symbiodinium sp. CCMP2592]|nr:unnamed protein product [Symbiodinium sp. CCMP2592]
MQTAQPEQDGLHRLAICRALTGIVKKLLEARADMDSPWLVSNSILETATWAQQEHIVSYLLQSKASLLSRRPLQMLAEAIAAARSAGASTQPLVQQLLKLMHEFTDPNEDAECTDLWLDRSCLLELRDLGMECLLKGDEASAVGLSEFLGRARCHEAAQRPLTALPPALWAFDVQWKQIYVK